MEQVERFNLTRLSEAIEDQDDEETRRLKEGLQNDTRAKQFRANHNVELFCVKLDPMEAEEAFDDQEAILREAINRYFDQDIYDKCHDTYFTEGQLKKWMIKELDAKVQEVRKEWEGDLEEEEEPPLEAPDNYTEFEIEGD